MGEDIVAACGAEVLFRDTKRWGLVCEGLDCGFGGIADEWVVGGFDVELAGDVEGSGAGVEGLVGEGFGGFEEEEPIVWVLGCGGQDMGFEESNGLG
ncbi:MAG: hypothetical protein RI897_3291 [Verrucomicrobiota bacterium]